jgi:pectinesterase
MMLRSISATLLFSFACLNGVFAASRTSPPAGAVVVQGTSPTSGQYKTIQSAVNALPNDSSAQTIFIYPGTRTFTLPSFQVNAHHHGAYL